ncbi:unnamed protein product [Mesocestoides corti]|uniref:HMG box domain-containing protein n=1 Tax=Mesocestoides corti TaxID=53468 RepID=A0A0R3UHB6_MESCO|nr:unnamed protein product [Mesocestoides corti]
MDVVKESHPFLYMTECTECHTAKRDGVESFIIHLAKEHSIPTEWPSDRAARLTGAEAKKPYTTVAATRKKRRKLTTPRPLNSFMIFAQHIRRNVLAIFEAASSSNVSRLLGEAWNSISKEVRAAYDEEAARLSKIHNIEFPTYKYQPKPRQWQPSSVTATTPAAPATVDDSCPAHVQPAPTPTSTVSWLPATTVLTVSIPSATTSVKRPSSPVAVKPEPPTTPPSFPQLLAPASVLPASPLRPKILIRDIRPSSAQSRTSRLAPNLTNIAPTTLMPPIPPLGTAIKPEPFNGPEHNTNNHTSPCPSSPSPPPRTPSPIMQFTSMQEGLVAETNIQLQPKPPIDISVQQKIASELAVLQKLINQSATTSQQTQQQQTQTTPKPCILLTPIQSDIGQQAIISCGQSSTLPTLLTCGNTIYVALTVMQAPLQSAAVATGSGLRVPATQEHAGLEVERPGNSGGVLETNLVDLLRSLDTSQIHSTGDSRLAELLKAAAATTGK